MGIQTPTNCGHRVDGGVLNPMAQRQIVQRYPNDREQPPAFCPLPSASQPKADKIIRLTVIISLYFEG